MKQAKIKRAERFNNTMKVNKQLSKIKIEVIERNKMTKKRDSLGSQYSKIVSPKSILTPKSNKVYQERKSVGSNHLTNTSSVVLEQKVPLKYRIQNMLQTGFKNYINKTIKSKRNSVKTMKSKKLSVDSQVMPEVC